VFVFSQELNRHLYEAIEVSLKGIDGAESLIDNLYRVNTSQEITCTECNNVSATVRPADFDLGVQVKGCNDLAAGLLGVVERETLSGYRCSQCDDKVRIAPAFAWSCVVVCERCCGV